MQNIHTGNHHVILPRAPLRQQSRSVQTGWSRVIAVGRLLIAAVVLLAGPAQAVDYVKCEAMKNAIERINNGIFYDAIKLKSKEAIEYAQTVCLKGEDREKYYTCLQSESKKFSESNTSRFDGIITTERDKLRRIRRDFADAGCNY